MQMYRNQEFFKFCSYDIFTVLTQPFDVLFRRDAEISQLIFQRAQACLKEMKGVEPANVPPHEMQEHFARNSKIFSIDHKWCSPVVSSLTGKTLGLFCSQRATEHGKSNVSGIGFVRA